MPRLPSDRVQHALAYHVWLYVAQQLRSFGCPLDAYQASDLTVSLGVIGCASIIHTRDILLADLPYQQKPLVQKLTAAELMCQLL